MPRRRNSSSAISFFSFQDIMMSVVGIIILVTLLLILKLITQKVVAEPVPRPEITESELNERINELEQARREIQDEITTLNQSQQNAAPFIPSRDQLDVIRSSVERLEQDVQTIEEDIQTVKEYHQEMADRPDATLAAEMEEKIRVLELLRNELHRKINDQKQQQQTLQTEIDDLQKQQAELDRRLAEEIVHRVYAMSSKATDKTPYLLIYGQGTISVISQADPKGQSFRSKQAFFSWVAGRDKKTEYLVLYVRPSRFDEYASILDQIKQLGFDVGLQVIGEKTEIFLQ